MFRIVHDKVLHNKMLQGNILSYPARGFLHPRAGDEGEIFFSLKLPLATRFPRPEGRGILKIFAAKIFNQINP
ncbi:MAG: hypothetical protein HY796_04500 [Elusimicrobia bacterium]|nr:hypothetical protein [Elusimicrobiota bacterium]